MNVNSLADMNVYEISKKSRDLSTIEIVTW